MSMAGGLELDVLQGPFEPKPFCDSLVHLTVLHKLLSGSSMMLPAQYLLPAPSPTVESIYMTGSF